MPMNPKKGSTAKQQQQNQINKSLPQKWLKEVYWINKMKSKKRKKKVRCHVINNKRNDFKAKVSQKTHKKGKRKQETHDQSVSNKENQTNASQTLR